MDRRLAGGNVLNGSATKRERPQRALAGAGAV
jgi:hypothetical protein